jgi:Domain of unknown function (DUF1707)
VSEVPISSPYRSTPEAPVTEGERNALSARLNAAYEAGALTSDDFAQRLDQLFAAQRMGDLLPVVQGLPPLPTHASPAIVTSPTAGAPGQLSPTRTATTLTVVTVGALVGVIVLIAILLIILL